MEYKGMSEIDFKLRLIGGFDVAVDGLTIKPYTIREIVDYGYENYMRNIQWLSITLDDFIESQTSIDRKEFLKHKRSELKTFDFYINLGGSEFLDMLVIAMRMIFRTDDIEVLEEKDILAINFVKNGVLFENKEGRMEIDNEFLATLDDKEIMFIHRDNFDEIVDVVKKQNYLLQVESKVETAMNPADEATKRLMEEMENYNKKVEEKKSKQKEVEGEETTDFFDIIDCVSTKSYSTNKINIWDMCIYAVYREYARLELIDTYDFSIQAMIAGAGKIDLKHWSSKL